jgi:hypothetical protein
MSFGLFLLQSFVLERDESIHVLSKTQYEFIMSAKSGYARFMESREWAVEEDMPSSRNLGSESIGDGVMTALSRDSNQRFFIPMICC